MRVVLALLCASVAWSQAPSGKRVRSLNIRVLSTMLADRAGVGDWGFAAVVEADGMRYLFDTGGRPGVVASNARELKVDLSNIRQVILSHSHEDHTAGLIDLRRAMPDALSTAYVARGFLSRRLPIQREYESVGGKWIEGDSITELQPGVYLTGPIPRPNPERNWGIGPVAGAGKEDTIPEDQAMVFDTDKGLVILTGCGHAGIINTIEYARDRVRRAPVYAVLGGMHMFQLDDEKLAWTAGKLRDYEVQNFLGAHCTGLEAVYRIRQLNKMDRRKCLVGSVGATFDLAAGIDPGLLAR